MRALEIITGHVFYNLAYTYKFQLKTTHNLTTTWPQPDDNLMSIWWQSDDILTSIWWQSDNNLATIFVLK